MYEYKAQVIRVIDGDTLEICVQLGLGIMRGNTGDPFIVRLAGIDTPELRSRDPKQKKKAQEAKKFVESWLTQESWDSGGKECNLYYRPILIKTVKTQKGKERKTFGRYVAHVFPYEIDVDDEEANKYLMFRYVAHVFPYEVDVDDEDANKYLMFGDDCSVLSLNETLVQNRLAKRWKRR